MLIIICRKFLENHVNLKFVKFYDLKKDKFNNFLKQNPRKELLFVCRKKYN